MCTSHVSVRPGIVVGLCLAILAMGACVPLVSAGVGSPGGPLTAAQHPARPVYGPPGPKPDLIVPVVTTPTTAPADVPLPPPTPSLPLPAPTVGALPLPPTAPVLPLTCGLVTDFEQFGTWKRGDEPFGTFSQSSDQVYSGMNSGQFSYSFPTAGNDYVVFMRTIPMGGTGSAVTAWVYGDNSGHYLNTWVKDAGGEVWSFPFGRIQHLGWQQMTAPLDVLGAWPTGHVSGPANGVLDYPISFYAIVLDDAPDTYTGSGVIYIDDLSCSEAVSAPQPVLPAASPQAPLAPAAPPEPSYGPLTFGSGWDEENEKLTGVGQNFPYGITTLNVAWTVDNMSGQWSDRVSWYLDGNICWQEEGNWDWEWGDRWTGLEYNEGEPLLPGTYRVDVEVNGRVMVSGECWISGP